MSWDEQSSEILPENDDEFDGAGLAEAITSERKRQYAALSETEPLWLDDVA